MNDTSFLTVHLLPSEKTRKYAMGTMRIVHQTNIRCKLSRQPETGRGGWVVPCKGAEREEHG